MSQLEDFVVLLFVMVPAAVLWAVIDAWQERREFRRWLREGRWKFEKFRR